MLMILTEVSLCISKSFGFLKGKELKRERKREGGENVTWIIILYSVVKSTNIYGGCNSTHMVVDVLLPQANFGGVRCVLQIYLIKILKISSDCEITDIKKI